jgi:hypothetical protein
VLVVRDQIASVRGPFISAGEVAAAFKEAGIEPEDEGVTLDKRADELVYDRRWRSLSKAMTDLQLELLEAEVLWGEQVRAPEEKFRRVVAEVYVAVLHHVRSRSNSANEDKLPAATREKFFQALYQTSTDPSEDPICGRVAEAIDEFEALLRPHLRLTRSQPTRAA